MQRVSSLLPSWDRRISGSGSGSGSLPNNANANAHHANSTTKPATGGGLFGWSNRSSTTSTNTTNGLSKINIKAANRSSSAASIMSARIQREAFWPATLDVESEKAARIIKSFCADGYLAPLNSDESNRISYTQDEPKTPLMVPKKIPKRIIQNAAGIAVFTCMRNGLWMTGSGGSGILIARKSDGTWSSPSGIMLHTPTLSFIIGVDIYDCVLVINSLAALESITRPRVTLGEDVGLASGTLVPLDSPETEINLKELGNTVMAYMKARGQDQRVNLHGCILTERSNENERFYESPVSQMDILSGDISRHVEETQPLLEVIKLAEGRTDFDAALVGKVAKEPAPGDAVIASPSSTPASPRPKFGQPNVDDPDPFGILALEMAGLEIREAGTRLRPTSSQLDFHPRPASQLSKIHRQSGDTYVTRSNRESALSTRTVKSQVTDAYTQTDTANTPETSPSPGRSEDGQVRTSFDGVNAIKERDEEEDIDYTTVDLTVLKHLSRPPPHEDSTSTGPTNDPTRLEAPSAYDETDRSSKVSSVYGSNYGDDENKDHSRINRDIKENSDADDEDDDDASDDEEPVVFEVATVQTTSTQAVASRMVHAKGSMVTIPKRIPPPLPARNPARASLASKSDLGDTASLRSPLRQAFSEADLNMSENQGPSTVETRRSAEEKRSQSPLPSSGLKTEVPRIEEPEVDTPTIDKTFPVDAKLISDQTTETQEQLDDTSGKTSIEGQADKEDSVHRSPSPATVPLPADSDEFSDSQKKGRLSIDTKATDDASSPDESSYTTPTSERRFSFSEKAEGIATPKKDGETQRTSSDEATPTKLHQVTSDDDATDETVQTAKAGAATTNTTG